jgi:hypothetical protein
MNISFLIKLVCLKFHCQFYEGKHLNLDDLPWLELPVLSPHVHIAVVLSESRVVGEMHVIEDCMKSWVHFLL